MQANTVETSRETGFRDHSRRYIRVSRAWLIDRRSLHTSLCRVIYAYPQPFNSNYAKVQPARKSSNNELAEKITWPTTKSYAISFTAGSSLIAWRAFPWTFDYRLFRGTWEPLRMRFHEVKRIHEILKHSKRSENYLSNETSRLL